MPAWPDFAATSKPIRRAHRSPPRTSRQAMQALGQWFVWTRAGGKQSRPIRIVAELVNGLPERERQVIEGWLAGSLDRDISARLALPIETVARVRFETLQEIGVRLSQRPARAPVGDDW